MLELSVTAFCAYQIPTIFLNELDHISNLHSRILIREVVAVKLTVPVWEVRASVGAGFIYPLLGEMRTMLGLGSSPVYMRVDVDEEGKVVGLF